VRVLFLGDINGRPARQAVIEQVPEWRRALALDFVIANGENAAAGFGITGKIAEALFDAGVDVITTGNHVWDQKEVTGVIEREPRLLRPANFPERTPGSGYGLFQASRGRQVLVINVMGRVFMDPLDDPFAAVDALLERHTLGRRCAFALVDIHAEATSEKMAMGHFCDGRASCVVGTHSHVPTADTMILPGGTAYQTDAGMCGDYDSVIGMDKEEPLRRFTRKIPGGRFTPAMGAPTLCGLVVETDDATGKAVSVSPLRSGGLLSKAQPTG